MSGPGANTVASAGSNAPLVEVETCCSRAKHQNETALLCESPYGETLARKIFQAVAASFLALCAALQTHPGSCAPSASEERVEDTWGTHSLLLPQSQGSSSGIALLRFHMGFPQMCTVALASLRSWA